MGLNFLMADSVAVAPDYGGNGPGFLWASCSSSMRGDNALWCPGEKVVQVGREGLETDVLKLCRQIIRRLMVLW